LSSAFAAAATLAVVAVAAVSANVAGLLIQSAMDDLVAWDPAPPEDSTCGVPNHAEFPGEPHGNLVVKDDLL
jgi:hypothetical protein